MNPKELLSEVREFCRLPFADGGYPKILVMTDGETLCHICARSEYRQISNATRHNLRDGWQACGVDIHWEGAPMDCAHCGAQIDSAYGEPDVES